MTDEVFEAVDAMVLRVGAILQRAFEEHPRDYERWVESELPFSLDKARRLRMIWKATRTLSPERLAALPRPWQALYALSRLGPERLEEAIDDGTVTPTVTVERANEIARELKGGRPVRSHADALVGRLVSHPPESLSGDARAALAAWTARIPPAP